MEEKQQRIDRTLEKIGEILKEEHCELEPFILIVGGNLIKKEINVVAKPLPVEGPVNESVEESGKDPVVVERPLEGGDNISSA